MEEIENILIELGINPSKKGFTDLVKIIEYIYYQDFENINMMDLYDKTNGIRTERNLRTLFAEVKEKLIEKGFNQKIRNKEVVYWLAYYVYSKID